MLAKLGRSPRLTALQPHSIQHVRLFLQRRHHWLLSRKNEELKQAAIACGTPCSGTKQLLAEGLEDATSRTEGQHGRELSIVSIDMGIRNLAYCNLKTRIHLSKHAGEEIQSDVKIGAWQRIDVSSGQSEGLEVAETSKLTSSPRRRKSKSLSDPEQNEETETAQPTKESFDPTIYAERSYKFIGHVLQQHQPTHILIERQRFRSGGGPAVQEWTLRVGMFEFMLYATLHTLAAQGVHTAKVVPVQPSMVNRSWFSQNEPNTHTLEAKPTSAAMKKYKIELLARMLDDDDSETDRDLSFSGQALNMKEAFLERLVRAKKGPKKSALPKLDDVSDCLLQGLAWISWQENRGRLHALKSTVRHRPVDIKMAENDPLLPRRIEK